MSIAHSARKGFKIGHKLYNCIIILYTQCSSIQCIYNIERLASDQYIYNIACDIMLGTQSVSLRT